MAAEPLPLEDEELEAEPMDDMEDSPDIEGDTGVDPMFAADISEAFPDMDDTQVAALQRAVLGLISGGGGGMGGPPTGGMPPMGF